MAHSPLSTLPPELLQTIFAQLPISSLLAFAQTNKTNYVMATSVLTYLELAIFPKNIHSLLAFLEEDCRDDVDDEDSIVSDQLTSCFSRRRRRKQTLLKNPDLSPELYQISYATQTSTSRPESPSTLISGYDRKLARRSISPSTASPLSIRTAEFVAQNNLATTILASRSIRHNVKSLKLNLYTLHTQELATVLSSLSLLQHLNLNFTHPYINDTTLPANYWRTTPAQGSGSPIWNSLAGIGPEASAALELRNLRTLTLRRAGITSYQLRSWIASNPCLRDVILEKVRGVDLEFVNWLADYIVAQNERIDLEETISTVVMVDCSELTCGRTEDFDWITKISHSGSVSNPQLTTLSLKGCKNVDDILFCSLGGFPEPLSSQTSSGINSPVTAVESDMDTELLSPRASLSGLSLHTETHPWSDGIYRLVSPNGTLIKEGKRIPAHYEQSKVGTRSPALTINEVFADNSFAQEHPSAGHNKWSRQHEEMIEVDPELL